MRKKILIIGSSPISLMKAILEAKQGGEVFILEKNNILGGGWSYQNLEDLKNIELGPHYIKNRGNSYKKLELFGVKLSNLISDVIWLDNFKQFSYLKFSYLKFKNLVRLFLGREIKSKYLKGGSYKLVSTLIDLLGSYKIKIHYNCEVISINQNKEELNIVSANNIFKANKCYLFSGSKIDKININKKIIEDNYETKNYVNVVLLFKKKVMPNKLSIKIHNPNFISFLNDLTPLTEKNRQLIGLRINQNITKEMSISKIIDELKPLSSKISKDNLISYKINNLVVPYRKINDIEKLNSLLPKSIRFIYSADLTNGLSRLNIEPFYQKS